MLCGLLSGCVLVATGAMAAGSESAEKLDVAWYAPIFSGGGYCSEALAYIESLAKEPTIRLAVRHFADSLNPRFAYSLPPTFLRLLSGLSAAPIRPALERGIVRPTKDVVECLP